MRTSLGDVFYQVADLSTEARSRYFSEHGVDERIRSEVEAMLAVDSRTISSLDRNIGLIAQRLDCATDRRPV